MSLQTPIDVCESMAAETPFKEAAGGGRRPLVVHWVFGHLHKRGSFEDYLIKAAETLAKAHLRMRVVARRLVDPAIRRALEDRGAGVTCVPDEILNSSLFFAGAILKLRPSLVHCHFGSPSTSLAAQAKLLGRRRFVFTDHGSRTGLESGGSILSPRYLRRRLLSRFVDLYLPVSDFVGEQVRREVGAPAPKVARLYNGIDLARFHPLDPDRRTDRLAPLIGASPGRRYVFYVGQLTEAKGVDDILAIQDEVLRLKDDVSFVWIGDGPLAPEVQRRTSARVHYLGLRNDVDVLLPAASMIVAPSRWHEAFCLTVAEAAAAGAPAVASRVGGIPEVVVDGVTGLLIEPGDREALLGAIMRLLEDEPLRRAMSVAARRRAEDLFGLDAMVDITLQHYRALGLPTHVAETAARAPVPTIDGAVFR